MIAAMQNVENAGSLQCVVCGTVSEPSAVKTSRVRSNVRHYLHETFAIWQCPACQSIHARDEVDLAHYYEHYPLHDAQSTPAVRLAYQGKLKVLEQLGLRKEQRVLDYGCGGGVFVQYLQSKGYAQASGYDAYVKEGPYSVKPSGLYDAVMSQDVIEHDDLPRSHLERLIALTVPGGMIMVGTPNAEVVDMDHPERKLHVLHQPYHRHVLALSALVKLSKELACEVLKVRKGFVGNRLIPGINGAFLLRVLRANDDVLDTMVEGKLPWKLEMFGPGAIYDFFAGYWRDPGNDIMVVLRAPRS